MKLKNISILALGVCLVYCGMNFQPVSAGIDGSSKTEKNFSKKTGDKFKIQKRHEDNLAKQPTLQDVRAKLEANLSSVEKKAFNDVKKVVMEKEFTPDEKILKIEEMLEDEKNNKNNKISLLLRDAITTIAFVQLEGDDQKEILKKYADTTPNAKFLMEKNPNRNLVAHVQVMYRVLIDKKML